MGLLIKLLLSYLLGSVLGSLLLGRLRGVDVRQHGSGNAGATNALRVLGRGMAVAVLAIDAGKGVLAVTLIPALPFGPARNCPGCRCFAPSPSYWAMFIPSFTVFAAARERPPCSASCWA